MKMWKYASMALLVTGMLFGTAEANATTAAEPNPASLKLLKSEKKNSFKLFFNPLQQEKATLKLKDLNGNVLWRTKLDETEAFAKLVNLRNLPDGNYNVYVSGETSELIQPVTLKNNLVNIDAATQSFYKFPSFTESENLIKIELLTSGAMDVRIEVSDKKGEAIYSDEVPVSSKLIQKLDISSLPNGSYLVKVETPHRSFYHEVEIR